ncbi:MAG: alpha/beta hydrolase, partial [Pseudomonadota bacterium]|nr:alpha/beta hydrolase [Pseudomonadota bacterium]
LPCLTFLGDAEAIVDPARVLTRMHNWPEGELVMLPDARHEVLMETPETRAKIFDRLIPFLNDHATAPPAPARSA